MDTALHTILEELDNRLADFIDRLEAITPNLKDDSDAFIADDVKYLCEDIRGILNEER